MRVAIAVAALLLAAAAVPAARAQLAPEPISGRFGNLISGANGRGGVPENTNVLSIVYDNTASAPNFGFTSPDLAASFGDELLTTGTGLLSQNKFTLFNSGSSAGALLTATVGVSFFDAVTSTFLGGYSTNLNFGAGLAAGNFTLITVTGLDP